MFSKEFSGIFFFNVKEIYENVLVMVKKLFVYDNNIYIWIQHSIIKPHRKHKSIKTKSSNMSCCNSQFMKDVMNACPVLVANAGDWFNITGDNFQTLFEFLGRDEENYFVFRYMYGDGFSSEDNRIRDILEAWPVSLYRVGKMAVDRFIRVPADRLWAFVLEEQNEDLDALSDTSETSSNVSESIQHDSDSTWIQNEDSSYDSSQDSFYNNL